MTLIVVPPRSVFLFFILVIIACITLVLTIDLTPRQFCNDECCRACWQTEAPAGIYHHLRAPSNWYNCLPDLVSIGAPKCGTTFLWRTLSHHRQLLITKSIYFKEPHFYNWHYNTTNTLLQNAMVRELQKIDKNLESDSH